MKIKMYFAPKSWEECSPFQIPKCNSKRLQNIWRTWLLCIIEFHLFTNKLLELGPLLIKERSSTMLFFSLVVRELKVRFKLVYLTVYRSPMKLVVLVSLLKQPTSYFLAHHPIETFTRNYGLKAQMKSRNVEKRGKNYLSGFFLTYTYSHIHTELN